MMKDKSAFATFLIILTAIFLIVEVLLWTGVIPSIEVLGNLGYGVDQWLENPAFAGLMMTLLVALGGYLENFVRTGEPFNVKKFAETFYLYEPLLILLSQFLPLNYAVVLTFAVDVLRRIAWRIKPPPPKT